VSIPFLVETETHKAIVFFYKLMCMFFHSNQNPIAWFTRTTDISVIMGLR
jgi:hypothetical protein